MSNPQFKNEDVWKVAQTLLDHFVIWDVQCGMNAYNECRYCNGHVYWDKDGADIVHDSNCPVLVAKDLLTGAPDDWV